MYILKNHLQRIKKLQCIYYIYIRVALEFKSVLMSCRSSMQMVLGGPLSFAGAPFGGQSKDAGSHQTIGSPERVPHRMPCPKCSHLMALDGLPSNGGKMRGFYPGCQIVQVHTQNLHSDSREHVMSFIAYLCR